MNQICMKNTDKIRLILTFSKIFALIMKSKLNAENDSKWKLKVTPLQQGLHFK